MFVLCSVHVDVHAIFMQYFYCCFILCSMYTDLYFYLCNISMFIDLEMQCSYLFNIVDMDIGLKHWKRITAAKRTYFFFDFGARSATNKEKKG